MYFEFSTAGRILFGRGTVEQVPAAAAGAGRVALLVTGRGAVRAAQLVERLRAAGVAVVPHRVDGEPTLAAVVAGAALARFERCALVIGFGGGSALDAAKAIAAAATNTGDFAEHLEVVGRAAPLAHDPLPWIAVPTTAGTGAEVTRNAVLSVPAHRVKVSLRDPRLYARLAVVDPALTLGVPPAVTAATGLDALTQLIEPFVSARANPLTDGLCREGLQRSARSLRRAHARGDDLAAREDLALASLLGGLALANAGLGAVHGLAAPLGGELGAPHGAICAALLPHVMEVNVRALRARAPDAESLARYGEVGRILCGSPSAGAAEAVAWVRETCVALDVPGLRAHGLAAGQVPGLVEKARGASSMKGNPVELAAPELAEILERAM